ncbi:hypothetical protein GCM10010411_17320 [Actinomadura fulvescens]|uniref:Uncharacterized protein n=2 Tax=Actinomadura fulvescens TaxID=46160 RepID=A0ABN3PGU7_9ACTN
MLSYAHSPPLSGQRPGDLDRWVGSFFQRLDAAVAEIAPDGHRLDRGFCDQLVPLGSDWKQAITAGLETAEVFVPLYSAAYFSRSQSGREWECFHRRVQRAGVANPMSRFVPVLWTPLMEEQHRAWAQDAPLFEADVPAYAENGLKALSRLAVYQDAYLATLERLAARIVAISASGLIGPSSVDDVDRLESPFRAEAAAKQFVVTVAAPTAAALPAGRRPDGYGADSAQWRAFPADQELSLVSYATAVAERLDFAVLVTGVEKAGDDLAGKPGVMLVDPWFVANERDAGRLAEFARGLSPWVLPIILVDPAADARSIEFARRAEDILRGARTPSGERAVRALRTIRSFEEFVSLMPFLIADAEREYLRKSPLRRPITKRRPRPKLTRGMPPEPGGMPPESGGTPPESGGMPPEAPASGRENDDGA